jgi:hypothetical protein
MIKDGDEPDKLVPDPQAWREFGVSAMAWWRWGRDADLIALGFPPPVKIRGRNFRSRRQLEIFKQRMLRRAIADRSGKNRGGDVINV